MSWRNNKKSPPSTNPSGSWTDNNTKKSKFSVSGLLKGKSSRKNYLKIVGILFVLAFLLGIVTIILISTQSQGTEQYQNATTLSPLTTTIDPLTDPDCSNCTCFAVINLSLDITTDLTLDAFKLQNEFVNYYISKLYDPQVLANDSQININYGIDGGNFGIKWPTVNDNRTLQKYFEDGDIQKKQQEPGKFNDLYNILLGIFLIDAKFCPYNEFFVCYNGSYIPQNNIVFMGSPSITAPPNNILDLTYLSITYNGTNEINLTKHYFHGPTGRNKFIVILMKEDTEEKWNKTNLRQWLDVGLHVLQYTNDNEQLFYDVRKLLSCDVSNNQTYINLPDIKEIEHL